MPPRTRYRYFLRSFAAGLSLLPALLACGGRSDMDDWLYASGEGGSSTTGASSSTGAKAGGAGKGEGGLGTGANGSGATGSGAMGSGATGSGGGAGPIGVGGKATGGASLGGFGTGGNGQGASGGVGAAGEPSGPRVTCGDASCDNADEQCCAGLGGFECMPKGAACNGAVLACSNSSDCPGNTACCLRVIEAEVGSSSRCKAACAVMGPSRERQLCQFDEECPFGQCRPTVFGVNVCTRF